MLQRRTSWLKRLLPVVTAAYSATLSQITGQKEGSGGDDFRGRRHPVPHPARCGHIASSQPQSQTKHWHRGLSTASSSASLCLFFTCRSSDALLRLHISLLFIPASVTSASLCPVTVEPAGRSFFVF